MGQLTPALRIASWAVCLLALAIGLFSAVLSALLGVDTFRISEDSGLLAWVIASTLLGLILVVRAEEHSMGWLMLVIGLGPWPLWGRLSRPAPTTWVGCPWSPSVRWDG